MQQVKLLRHVALLGYSEPCFRNGRLSIRLSMTDRSAGDNHEVSFLQGMFGHSPPHVGYLSIYYPAVLVNCSTCDSDIRTALQCYPAVRSDSDRM